MRRRRQPEGETFFDIWDQKAAEVAAQNQALVHERKAEKRRIRSRNSRWTPGRQVLAEIGRLISERHNGPCDTADAETYFRAALPWLIEKAGGSDEEGRRQIMGWSYALTPSLEPAEANACFAEAERRDERKNLYWRPDELGKLLQLTTAERERLGITMIRPAGMTDRKFKAYQRARKTANEKARRARAGATPREQSAAQVKPWEALGISKRTYYRQQKAGLLPGRPAALGTNSCPPDTKYLQPAAGQGHGSEQTAPGPARKASPRQSVGAGGHSPRDIPRIVAREVAAEPPLSEGGSFVHPDLIGLPQALGAVVQEVVERYTGGIMPPEVVAAVREAQRGRMLKQEDVARQIGVSRPQLANALQRRFGLSPAAALNLRVWLAA